MYYKQVEKIIRDAIGGHWIWFLAPPIYLSDGEYVEVSPDQMKEDMKDFVPSRPYTKTKHDCDDQTFEELGHMTKKVRKARGFAWSTAHAFCIFIWKGELWIYDRGNIGRYVDFVNWNPKTYKIRGWPRRNNLLLI